MQRSLQPRTRTALAILVCHIISAASEQPPCPPGTYKMPGGGTCTPCERHTWNSIPGQDSCTPCLPGTQLPSTGATSNTCQECPDSQTSVAGGACYCPAPDFAGAPCRPWPSVSPGSPATCDYAVEFRNMLTGACTVARGFCGTSGGLCCPLGLRAIHTKTQDSVCYTDNTYPSGVCPPTHYTFRSMERDANGVVTRALECRQLDVCSADQYELRPPGQFQNRVCVYKTNCGFGDFYEAVPATPTSDAICRPRTLCATGEFLLSRGGAKSDNTCSRAVIPCPFGSYLSALPTNASSDGSVNGTAGTCSIYTACQPGDHPVVPGTQVSDQVCGPCPAGTYGFDGTECSPCRAGITFNPSAGARACLPCTQCLSNTSIAAPGYGCPPGGSCQPSLLFRCNATHDSICMQCPPSWRRSAASGMCTRCADGFHDLGGTGTGPGSCAPCPANTYCDGAGLLEPCPNVAAFESSPGSFTFVPSSPPESSRDMHCTCTSSGGFDGGGVGLDGCTPCEDGYFLPTGSPAWSTCTQCPMGTWSKRVSVRDHMKCPIQGLSPLLLGPDGSNLGPAQASGGDCNIIVGASACVECQTRKTRVFPATGPEDCSLCNMGEWHDAQSGACRQCSPPCESPGNLSMYESSPCTDTADRVCSECNTTCERAGEFSSSCPGHDVQEPGRGCGRCTNLPVEHAFYTPKPNPSSVVRNEAECPWACEPGFFTVNTVPRACSRCAQFNSTSCPAGLVHSPCTTNANAACTNACSNSTMPTAHASYALTTRVRVQEYRLKDPGDSTPNEGCMWVCDPGYSLSVTRGGLQTCRLDLRLVR